MFRTALISMFLTSTALADTWTVDDSGGADFDNIQAAIDAASDGDEIVVMPGTYTSTQDGHVVNMQGKAVTLRSSDPSDPEVVAATIIDGEDTRRGIACYNNETSKTIISGFTITNGYGTGFDYNGNGDIDYYEDGRGGGMFNYESSDSTLTNCTFTGNSTNSAGGGMYNWYSSPTLENCIFTGNTSTYIGGGMFNQFCSPSLTNCTFTDNTAEQGAWMFFGGGMFNNGDSSPTLTDTTVCGNTPDQIDNGSANGDDHWIDNGGNWVADVCPECPDINGDGYVDVSDLLTIIDEWGLTDSPADINDDGVVNVSDLLLVISNWGECE